MPRERIRGVRGRIDLFGDEAIPLYEDEARAGDRGAAATTASRASSSTSSTATATPRTRTGSARSPPRSRPTCRSSSPQTPLSDAPRLPAAELDPDRGLRGRAVARAARSRCARPRATPGAAFDLRIMAAHGGTISIEAQRAGAHPDLRADRRRDRRALPRRAGSRTARPNNIVCTDIGGHELRHRADHRRRVQRSSRRRHRALHAQPAAGAGGLDRRGHRLVRAHRPQLRAARAGPGLGRRADRRLLGRGRARDAHRHRPQPRARPREPRLLPRRRHQARHRARPRGDRGADREARSGSSVEQAAAGIVELFDETLKYEAVAQVLGKGYSPVDYTLLCYGGGGPLHVAGYTRRRARTATCWCRPGRPASRPSAAPAATSPTATT